MRNNSFMKGLSAKEIIILLLVVFIGIVYVFYIKKDTINQAENNILQVASSVEASLPKQELKFIPDNVEDLRELKFEQLKKSLRNVIEVNPKARFAYVYIMRNNRYYFLADSEPESSPDYSYTGQEMGLVFDKNDSSDRKLFYEGKALVTMQVEDRWGSWVSVQVPVRDEKSGQLIAAFGMDYNAQLWRNRILFEVSESILMVIIILVLVFVSNRSNRKNHLLEKEITQREKAEKELKENELILSNLIGNLPGMAYRCSMDENYTMKFMSDGCFRITGYHPEDFIANKNISFKTLILPEYRQPIWEKWQKILTEKSVFEAEYPIQTASGEIKWVWERGACFYDENGDIEFLEGYIEDITTNKLAEEKLRQSEANLDRIIEESPFGIRIVSGEGSTLYANPTLLRIFGFESLNDFNQIPATNWYHPKSYTEHLLREEKRRKGEPVESCYEISIISDNNEIRYLQVFRNEILWNGQKNNQIIYLDITNRKLAENELRKLSRAIEQNPVSVVITNSDGIIEYVNPKFTEMTGYLSAEAIGKNPRLLKSGKMNPQIYTDLWSTIISGKIWQGELINRKKSGEFYWVFKSISPIFDDKNQITNFVAISEDITAKKKNEAELIQAKEKAQESDRLKSAFLANISHEIRTPMNGIMGFAELLKEPDLSPENQHEFIGVIEQSGHRMLNIINDLIDISKIEAGETTLRIRETNVNRMLHDLHLFFMPEVNQKSIYLDYHCDLSDLESIIETDFTKLNQILMNLIKNAVKFTEKGSINFGYYQVDSKLEFYITDTGPGIHAEQKNLIFERFRQGTQSLNKIHEGAGLGLAISKAYVELLGGTIWIESEFGKGSTFRFTTPIRHKDH